MVTAAGAQSWRQMLAEEGWSRHLTTLEGWREFTTAQTIPPELLTGPQRAAMPQTGQLLYDEFRLDYHTRLAAVATSALRQVVSTGRRLTLLNRHAISARRGLILSGAAGTGKTTAITQFGKTRRADGSRDLRRLTEVLLQPVAVGRGVGSGRTLGRGADRVRARGRRPRGAVGGGPARGGSHSHRGDAGPAGRRAREDLE